VLVEAELPSIHFDADDGREFSYAHGMLGRAESPVRNEPIIYAFVPTLREWADRLSPAKALRGLWSKLSGSQVGAVAAHGTSGK